MDMNLRNHFPFSDTCYYDLDSNTLVDTSNSVQVKHIPISGAERTVLRKLIEDHPKSVHKDQFCALIDGKCDESHVRRIVNKLKKRHNCLDEWIPRASQGEYRLQDPSGSIMTKVPMGYPPQSLSCALKSTGICIRPNFVREARAEIFEQLDEAFLESQVVFLQGIGGIGKSEAAKHWALQKKKEGLFNKVVFAQLNCENNNDNVQSLVADDTIFVISGAFHYRDEEETVEAYFHRKLAKIKQITDERTLIIIDNYDIDDPQLAALFTGPYRLLVTTRNKQVGYDFPLIPVTEIQRTEHLKDIFFKNLGDERDDIDREDPYIEKLFALVSNHTLTIEIIAKSFVNSADTPESLFRKIGDAEQHKLMHYVDGLVERNFSEEPLPPFECIRLLFNLSLLERDRDFEYKSEVLVFMAAMPTRGIELSLLKKWSDNQIIRAKNSLIQKSWLRQDTAKGVTLISMHPLIREVVWHELEPKLEKCSAIIERFYSKSLQYSDNLYHQPKYTKDQYEQIALSLLSSFPFADLAHFDFYLSIQVIFHSCANPAAALSLAEQLKTLLVQEKQMDTWKYGFVNYRIGATYSSLYRDCDTALTYLCIAEQLMESTVDTDEEKMWLAFLYREIAIAVCQGNHIREHRNHPKYGEMAATRLNKAEVLISNIRQGGLAIETLDIYLGTLNVWRSKLEAYLGNWEYAKELIACAESEFVRLGYVNVLDRAAVGDVRALIHNLKGEYAEEIKYLKSSMEAYYGGFYDTNAISIERAIRLATAYQNNNQPEEAITILTHYQKIAEEMLGIDASLSITIRSQLEKLIWK